MWLFVIVRSGAGKHGFCMLVLYCEAFPKSVVVVPGMSFPKLKRHDAPVPAWLQNG